ncbi:MAG: oligosaccharide flippase family protein [Haloarculaceae archaeon]
MGTHARPSSPDGENSLYRPASLPSYTSAGRDRQITSRSASGGGWGRIDCFVRRRDRGSPVPETPPDTSDRSGTLEDAEANGTGDTERPQIDAERTQIDAARVQSDGPRDRIDAEERDALESISPGAVVSFGGIATERVLAFVTNLLLTNALGVVVYGIYAFARRPTGIVLRFAPLGSTGMLVKYVSAAADAERGQVAGLAYGTTLGMRLILALGLWVGAPAINDLTLTARRFPVLLRLLSIGLPFFALATIHVFLFRAVEVVNAQVVAGHLLRPGLALIAVFGASSWA